MNLCISLCDYSGNWAKPWSDNNYTTVLVDTKHPPGLTAEHGSTSRLLYGGTVRDFAASAILMHLLADVQDAVILAAPPCTDFSVSGAHTWAAKDEDGRTEASVAIVRDCLRVVALVKPRVWALENPIGRTQRLVPELGDAICTIQPFQFADREDKSAYSMDTEIGKFLRGMWSAEPKYWEAYTKKTKLWGSFTTPVINHDIEPIRYCHQGSWLQLLGGKSERTKTLRSMTPTGFARAFYYANLIS